MVKHIHSEKMLGTNTHPPLFDRSAELQKQPLPTDISLPYAQTDFNIAKNFLILHSGNHATYNAYRRELERLLHWSWFVNDKSILNLEHKDIKLFLSFCQRPPKPWVSAKKTARFIGSSGQRQTNPKWRLFSTSPSHINPQKNNYELSQNALYALLTLLNSFYNHLVRNKLKANNPFNQIPRKKIPQLKPQRTNSTRRLTTTQWRHLINTAKSLAKENPQKHERTLFIMTAMHELYLKANDFILSDQSSGTMSNFYQDCQHCWRFKSIKKTKDLAVSDTMLESLKRYRKSRGLTPALPTSAETEPLIHKLVGKGPITSSREIRHIIKHCFDVTANKLIKRGLRNEANVLKNSTLCQLHPS